MICDELSIYRDKIYAHSSRDCKSVRCQCSYGLQAYQVGELSAIKVSPRKIVIKIEALEKYINRK